MALLKHHCGECSSELPEDAKFCHECGAKAPSQDICTGCNAHLSVDAKFCPQCGAPARQQPSKSSLTMATTIDPDLVFRELTDLLAGSGQVATIDNDGDLSCRFTTARLPSFANDFPACAMQYSISVSAGGETVDDTGSLDFTVREAELSFQTPYCRVGKQQSASYQVEIKASFLAAAKLEVHEITLDEGKLEIPKLEASGICISSLNATKDNNDGSYGVEYEIEAYPEHYIYFDVLAEKPDGDTSFYGRLEEGATTSGTGWVYGLKAGQKIYVCFAEYNLIIKDVAASFTGVAEPLEGAYNEDSSGGDNYRGEDDASELEPTPADAQSGGMTRIKVNYCVDEGEYEFESESDRDEFVLNPTFNFYFAIDNVDDKEGVERVFGTLDVAPHFSTPSPEFNITRVEPSEDNETVAIVSVEVEMFFDIRISLADFLEWVEGEGDTWRYSGRIECAGEIGLINSEREEYESYLEVTGILNPSNTGAAWDIVQSVTEQLAGAFGLTIFISEDTDGELIDTLICDLESDGALLVQIGVGASYMDYIAPLMETEEGDTAILDGVQHIDESLIGDFLRIVSDRVLVGTIGEGDDAQSFEMPMSSFNLVLIDRGGGETSAIREAATRTNNPNTDILQSANSDLPVGEASNYSDENDYGSPEDSPLSLENADFYENSSTVDIDPERNARDLVYGNPSKYDLLNAIRVFLDRTLDRFDNHEDFMRDACAFMAGDDGPYQSIRGLAYSYDTGDDFDPNDEYCIVTFDHICGYALSGESGLDDLEIGKFTYQMLDAVCQTLDHSSEIGFEVSVEHIPDHIESDYEMFMISKVSETIGKISTS